MTAQPIHEDFHRGLDLFDRGQFFEAHEVLEDVWRSLPRDRPLRLHLQGLVQLAVAFHHQSTGNHVGAHSVLERALRNLHDADGSFPELDLDGLRSELEIWRRYLEDSTSKKGHAARKIRPQVTPALPKILRRR